MLKIGIGTLNTELKKKEKSGNFELFTFLGLDLNYLP